MSKYPLTSLKDKIAIKHGFPFKSEFFADEGKYIVLTPGNFYEEGGFKRELGKEKFYTGKIPQEYLLKKDDLIVAMTEQTEGLLGSCAFVPENDIYLHNQRLGYITAIDDIDLQYIYYLYQCKFAREQIRLTSSGSKVKHTSPDRLTSIHVPLPSKDVQQKIASVLSVLDAKIDCNNRINAELENMAKTLYDYWFVQFDFPDANGKPYKSSNGTMVYNEELKREIPEGWEVKNLGTLAFFNKESYSVKDAWQRITYLDTSSMTEGLIADVQIFNTEADKIPSRAKRKVQKGDIVFSTVRPNQRHYGILGDIPDNMLVSTGFATIRNKEPHISNYYIYLTLVQPQMENYLQQIAEGSTSAYPSITSSDLEEITIPCPPEELGMKFYSQVLNYYEMIDKKQKENQQLAKLRDWLLPMLMNGQVSIN